MESTLARLSGWPRREEEVRQPTSPAGRLEELTSSLRRKLKREEPVDTWKPSAGEARWEERGGAVAEEEWCTWDIPNGEFQFSQHWCGGGRGQSHMHTTCTH